MSTILVVSGPNLARLGSREPEIYGKETLDDIRERIIASAQGVDIRFVQSDSESDIVALMHTAVEERTPVILNPAAFTHYSYALRDACAMVTKAGIPLIEIHLSNPHTRETFRSTSVISGVATGVIAGFGSDSYLLAVEQILRSPREPLNL